MLRRQKARGRSPFAAPLLVVLLLGPLPALGASATDLTDEDVVLFPMPPRLLPAGESVTFDVSDPLLFALLTRETHYRFSATPMSVVGTFANMGQPENPDTWDVFNMRGELTFLGFPTGISGGASTQVTLVLLGFRQGDTVASAAADIGYIFNSIPNAPLFVSDGVGGQISDLFGGVFLALQFAAMPGTSYTFDYQLAVREPLPNLGTEADPMFTIFSFNTAFVPVPEPATLLLLALGLAGLVFFRRGATAPHSGV